jgi:predicted aspartyl protease
MRRNRSSLALTATLLLLAVGCGDDDAARDAETADSAMTTAPVSGPAGSPDANAGMRPQPSGPEHTELAQPVAVPLAAMQHQLTVEATVEGQGPYRFALDTGFPGLLQVSPELAQSLGLEQTGTMRAGDPGGQAAQEVPLVRVGTVAIGSATFSGIEAIAGAGLPEIAPDGVIGLRLFSGLTATLDYPSRQLRLSDEALPRSGEHVVAFNAERGVPQVEVDAAGVTVLADVDTGGPAALTVPSDTDLTFQSEPELVRQGRTNNSQFDVRSGTLAGDLRIAGWSLPNPTVEVVDAIPVASVGAALLRRFVVTFDLANARLALTQ